MRRDRAAALGHDLEASEDQIIQAIKIAAPKQLRIPFPFVFSPFWPSLLSISAIIA
jgi:hypothetical protein